MFSPIDGDYVCCVNKEGFNFFLVEISLILGDIPIESAATIGDLTQLIQLTVYVAYNVNSFGWRSCEEGGDESDDRGKEHFQFHGNDYTNIPPPIKGAGYFSPCRGFISHWFNEVVI